jgi:hypothetical protein
MRAHSENAALDIVAKLAKSDTANNNTSITNVIPGYRVGLAAS